MGILEEYQETLQEWKKWVEFVLKPRKRQCMAQPTLATYILSISGNEEPPKTSIINLVTSSDNPRTREEPRATTVEKSIETQGESSQSGESGNRNEQ